MPIPDLDENGHLPPGVHDCTFEELEEHFGQDQWVENRLRPCRSLLCARLEAYVAELRRLGVALALIVNGSFVTGTPEPHDIDLILVLPFDHDFARNLPPSEYNAIARKRVRDRYPFDLMPVADGGEDFRTAIEFFQQVRHDRRRKKGLLRLRP